MGQGKGGQFGEMGEGRGVVALQRRERPGGAHQRQFGAQTIGAELDAELGRLFENAVGHRDRGKALAGIAQACSERRFSGLGGCQKRAGIALETVARLDDGDAGLNVLRRRHGHRQAEAVEKLGPQLPFLRIAAADHHEAGGMAHREAFPFDDILAGGRDVEEEIDEMVLQKVDLVHIEKAAIGLGEKPRLEAPLAGQERVFQIEPADDAILARPERQIDDRDRHLLHVRRFAGLERGPALGAKAPRPLRIAAIVAIISEERRKHRRKAAQRRRLARSPVAEGQNAADRRIDGDDLQGGHQGVLTDDGGEGIMARHGETIQKGQVAANRVHEALRGKMPKGTDRQIQPRRLVSGSAGRRFLGADAAGDLKPALAIVSNDSKVD